MELLTTTTQSMIRQFFVSISLPFFQTLILSSLYDMKKSSWTSFLAHSPIINCVEILIMFYESRKCNYNCTIRDTTEKCILFIPQCNPGYLVFQYWDRDYPSIISDSIQLLVLTSTTKSEGKEGQTFHVSSVCVTLSSPSSRILVGMGCHSHLF